MVRTSLAATESGGRTCGPPVLGRALAEAEALPIIALGLIMSSSCRMDRGFPAPACRPLRAVEQGVCDARGGGVHEVVEGVDGDLLRAPLCERRRHVEDG